MADTAACASIMDGTNASSSPSRFDNDTGLVYLVDGSDCWNAVKADIDTQVAAATDNLDKFAQFGLPTTALTQALTTISALKSYGKGGMVYTAWQWDESKLTNGEDLGVCVYQTAKASCWSLTYNGAGKYSTGNSYLLDPNSIEADATLASFTRQDSALPAGTEGTWIVTAPTTAFDTTKIAFAARFIPASDTNLDPAFKAAATQVATYFSSRTTPANQGLWSAHRRLQGGFSSSPRFQADVVTLTCYDDESCNPKTQTSGGGSGGSSVTPTATPDSATTVATVGAILAASATMLAF